jgi:phosphatidylinositol 4-kinase
MAAYSLFTFLLQIHDRHNSNIMIDEDGHIIHIDFGLMFESSVYSLNFEPEIKITAEMGRLMGGEINAPAFQLFTELVIKGYLAIRPYREHIVSLVKPMLGLTCFRGGKALLSLRSRFQSSLSEREAASYIQSMVYKCYNNWRTNVYDNIGSLLYGVYC